MERSIKRTSLCRMSFSITRMPVFRLEIDPGFLFSMLLLAQQSCTCKDMAFACVFACVMLDVARILYFWFTLTNLTKSYVTWAQLQNIHNCCYALHLSWDWTCPNRVQKVTQIFPKNTPSELEQTLAQLIPSPKKARYRPPGANFQKPWRDAVALHCWEACCWSWHSVSKGLW